MLHSTLLVNLMKVGDRVRLNKENRDYLVGCDSGGCDETAIIEMELDFADGAVLLDQRILGMLYWNIQDLELVEETK